MEKKTWGILLGILDLLLLLACAFLAGRQDRTPPRLTVTEEGFCYREGMTQEELLEKVRAADDREGDLTDRVVVEKIVTDPESGTAVITYGAADSAGNVGRMTCTVRMEPAEGTASRTEPEEGSGGTVQVTEETEETGEENEAEPEEGGEPDEEDEAEPEEGEAPDEGTPQAAADPLPTAGEAGNEGNISTSDGKSPVILLREKEIRTTAGRTPAWVEVIEGLQDDTDDYGTLLQTLTVSGAYEPGTPGRYEVTLTVTDRDGNVSAPCPVTILVE